MARQSRLFAALVKEALGERSIRTAARLAQTSHTSIMAWLEGDIPIDPSVIRAFADGLKVSRTALLDAADYKITEEDREWDRQHYSQNEESSGGKVEDRTNVRSEEADPLLSQFGQVVKRSRRPHFGAIPAGIPEEREAIFREAREGPFDYELRVNGDSLIEADICDGDEIVIQPDREPKIGDIVVATVNGENVLKILAAKRENGETTYTLKPANGKYQEIREGDITIQGVVWLENPNLAALRKVRREFREFKRAVEERGNGESV